MQRVTYPAVRRAAYSYVKHGITIPDPYYWLEDPATEETKEFVTNQNKVFDEWIGAYPHRSELLDRVSRMQDYPRTGLVSFRHGSYYYYHNTGMQNQSVLYRMAALDDKEPMVFLDPNALSADGTSALGSTGWSKNERYFAYAINEKGSDWAKVYVKDGTTAEVLPDVINWVKFSGIAWLREEGFFYTTYPHSDAAAKDAGAEIESNENCSVYFHRLGTLQSEDIHVLSLPDHPKWLIGAEVSDCGKYVVITIHDGCEPKNLVWIAALPETFPASKRADYQFVKLVDQWVGEYSYLTNHGTKFFFQTTKDAPRRKIVAMDVADPASAVELIVAEQPSVLSFCGVARESLILCYLEDVKHVCYVRKIADVGGRPTKLQLPIGSVEGLFCLPEKSFVSLKMSSFLLPGRSFYFNIEAPEDVHVFRDDSVAGFNPDAFETKQIFYESEGAKIPMFIIHRCGVELNGNNPTLLYGYGGFNISVTPAFSPSRIVFLRNLGGILAIANIRGGGEYGEEWHEQGRRFTKQNCFTDFTNAAKWLHQNKYCNPSKLSIVGGSNGGLLVAACANQAPHLFQSVVAQVGVLDCLRFHLFTIGHAWTSDFGDPEVETEFHNALRWSPLHNIKTNTRYPAVLCCTGDHDDRVVPLHTHKYLASLQHANPEGGPFLGRIETASGHGGGKPTSKRIQEAADTYAFIAQTLEAAWVD